MAHVRLSIAWLMVKVLETANSDVSFTCVLRRTDLRLWEAVRPVLCQNKRSG